MGLEIEERRVFRLRPHPVKGAAPTDEITCFVSVVSAEVECSDEVWKRSQSFLSDTNDECSTIESMEDEQTTPTALTPSSVYPPNTQFVDYVRAGLDIDFCVAIDFTSSNGDPRVPGTLHYSR